MEWSDKPAERLRQLRTMSEQDRAVWLKMIAPPTKCGSWPYGMPSSAAPMWIVIGLTPGAREAGSNSPTSATNEQPTFGEPAGIRPCEQFPNGGGLFWNRKTNYFDKVRSLVLRLGEMRDSRLNEDERLALAGHLNLGTGQDGDGSKAELEPEVIRWVSSIIAEQMRPAVVVLLGWLGRLEDIAPHWNHSRGLSVEWKTPDRIISFETNRGTYKFRRWTSLDASGRKVQLVSWPNHPRRYPFASIEKWEESLNCLPRVLSAT